MILFLASMWSIDYTFVCFIDGVRFRVYVLVDEERQEIRRYFVREDE